MRCDWCDEEITTEVYIYSEDLDASFCERSCAVEYFRDNLTTRRQVLQPRNEEVVE